MNADDIKELYKNNLIRAKGDALDQIYTKIKLDVRKDKDTTWITGPTIDTISEFGIMDYIVSTLREEGFSVEPRRKRAPTPEGKFLEEWDEIIIDMGNLKREATREIVCEKR